MSQWFRDYLYIPLGGSRRGALRTYLNLALVFLLCGLWHGASWTFVAWGAYHGLFLVIERVTGLRRISKNRLSGIRRLFTLVVVWCGWVIFRCNDLSQAGLFFSAMFSLSANALPTALVKLIDLKNTVILLCSATALILPSGTTDADAQLENRRLLATLVGVVLFMVLLPWCVAIISSGSQNPFIYYRF